MAVEEAAVTALLVTTLAWLFGPGLALGLALRLRGWLLASAAPLLTLGLLAVATPVLPIAHIAWTPIAVLLVTLVATGLTTLATRAWTPTPPKGGPGGAPWSRYHHGAIVIALIGAGLLGVVVVSRATGGLQVVNQTWDAFYHAGAIRHISETGDPRPASLAAVAAPHSQTYFAPDTYHVAGALILSSTGASIPEVVNAIAALLPFVFGVGCVGVFRVLTGRPAHALCAAAGSASLASVPYQMTGYGALLPYGLAVVLFPGFLALLGSFLGAPTWWRGIASGLGAAALLNTHPQVAVPAALVGFLMLVRQLVIRREARLALLGGTVVLITVAAAASFQVIVSLLPSTASGTAAAIDWPAYTTPGGAIRDLLLFNATGLRQVAFAPLLAVGVLAVFAAPTLRVLLPVLATAAVVVWLYVLAGAYDTDLSLLVTSLWWNDRHRLGTAFTVLAYLLAVVGAVALRDLVASALRRGPLRRALAGRKPRLMPVALLSAGLLLGAVVTHGGYHRTTEATVAKAYGAGPTLSPTERLGVDQASAWVRADGGGAVMNDPHDGCGWAYALDGTDVVFPTPLTGPFDWGDQGYDREALFERFDTLDWDPTVRSAAEGLDVRWVMLCQGFIRGDAQRRAPGLVHVADMHSARLVYSNSEVQLYKLQEATD
ncbi:hypothetical protein LWC35_02465 [Pseudonocardia kujensis]|uniref:DUF6541 family protein n=1 Tax=Pseudonocardia kujensis TaxID=1128675 RepID=UPI001E613B54|nr:DUF6541 family protein [Pseudonocardia kujensis]MCE0761783.1 hypothetical protein [Pseudonocardia kujensis]